jgi:hypothetical protein
MVARLIWWSKESRDLTARKAPVSVRPLRTHPHPSLLTAFAKRGDSLFGDFWQHKATNFQSVISHLEPVPKAFGRAA